MDERLSSLSLSSFLSLERERELLDDDNNTTETLQRDTKKREREREKVKDKIKKECTRVVGTKRAKERENKKKPKKNGSLDFKSFFSPLFFFFLSP